MEQSAPECLPSNRAGGMRNKNNTLVFLGAGRVATHLALALQESGMQILQVYSRTEESASALARKLHADYTTSIDAVVSDAAYYFFSVSDAILPELAAALAARIPQACMVHTAGSMPLSVFTELGVARCGVFYPLQTFSQNRKLDTRVVPFFIEGSTSEVASGLTEMASAISTKVYPLSSEGRRRLHLAAVFANNFANHCYALAFGLLADEGLPFEVLLPLIDETAAKVHDLLPQEAQTGPAVRYDCNVLSAQSESLQGRLFYPEIYELMSRSIHHAAEEHKKSHNKK